MRARYMDTSTGRFVSEDASGNGTNWFVYCSNNPVNRTDVTGNSDAPAWLQCCFGLALFGGYNGGVMATGMAFQACFTKDYAFAAAACTFACACFWAELTGGQEMGAINNRSLTWGGGFLGALGGGLGAATLAMLASSANFTSETMGGIARVALVATLSYGIACTCAAFLTISD